MKWIKFPTPSTRALVVGAWSVVVAVLVLVAWMLFIIGRLSNDSVQTDRELGTVTETNAQQDATLTAQEKALKEANRRLRKAGEAPVSTPPVPVVDDADPDDPEIDDPDPDDPEIQQPEIDQPERQDAEVDQPEPDDPPIPGRDGTDGTNGVDGKDATDAQVHASVVEYCSARNECLGKDGPPGPAGPAGAPATCEGDFVCTAELDAAMAAALANYLNRDDVLGLLRALGCATDKPQLVTCSITGLP